MATKIELSGKRIGRLTVVREVFWHDHAGKHRKWLCLCDCWNEREMFQDRLVKATTVSCGCWQKEVTSKRLTRHGLSKSKVHAVWSAMLARCNNENNPAFNNYGGRGIKVCDRWMTFENFYADMGNPPFDGAELDRVNNNGWYSPENCRWASRKEQCSNTRQNVLVDIDGVIKTVAGWAEESGIAYKTISNRVKAGVTGKDLLARPHSGVRHGCL